MHGHVLIVECCMSVCNQPGVMWVQGVLNTHLKFLRGTKISQLYNSITISQDNIEYRISSMCILTV